MLKFLRSLLLLLLMYSCTKKETRFFDANNISEIQKKASETQGDSTYYYLKQAEQLILKNPQVTNDSLLTENYFALGDYFARIQQNDSSIYYKFKGIQSIDSISNQREINFFYTTYYQLESLNKYGDCTVLANEFEKKVSPNNYEIVYLVHYFREDIAKNERKYLLALTHNKKRNTALKKLNNSKLLVKALISRADIFYNLGKEDKSYKILDSLIVHEDEFSYDQRRQLYGDYALYTFYDNDFEKSLLYNLKVLENTKKDNQPDIEKNNSIAIAYANISEIHIELKQFNLAQKYIDSTHYVGFDNIEKRIQRSILKYQLRLQSLNNTDTKLVTNLLDSIFRYQDKSYQEKYNQELFALKIETQKKEQIFVAQQAAEIKAIKLETRLLIVVITAILIIFIGVLYFLLRKYRQEKESIYIQQRLLRTQMSPHFIFNTLSSIHNVMATNTERASKYLIKFSKLLRLVLENSLANYTPLEDELESLEQFLELQLLRFPEKFNYTITTEKLKPNTHYSIPPMLLQPFIENAILHGFKGIDYLGQITVSISEKNKYLQCVIEDNGIGLQEEEASTHKSVSVKLISEFVEKTTKSKISVLSKTNEKQKTYGVIVSFLIPYKTNT